MIIWKSGAKSHSPSHSADDAPSKAQVIISAVALFLSACVLCASIISYAWFSVSSGETQLKIDSGGIRLDAQLYFINDTNLSSLPDDSAFESTQLLSDKRTVSDHFYSGSMLAYKLVIQNNSNRPYGGESDITTAGVSADIALSFSDINNYFNDAVACYLDANKTITDVDNELEKNAGSMMFRFSDIVYKLDNGTSTQYAALTSDNTIAKDFADCQSFFEYEGLEPGHSITVYFMLECMRAFEAVEKYRSFRMAEAERLYPNYATVGSTDKTAYNAYLDVLDRELRSIVIEYDETTAEPGGTTAEGDTTSAGGVTNAAVFSIKYIKIHAQQHMILPDTTAMTTAEPATP